MAKGRPRKHPKLHLLRNTYRADRHGSVEDLAGVKLSENLPPPDYLDEYAQQQWRQLVPVLEAMGVLAEVDGFLVGMYCSQLSIYRQCEMELETDDSLTVETQAGGKRRHPCLGIMKDCVDTTTKLAALFGVGPMSRVKLQQAIPPPSPKPTAHSLLEPLLRD